MDFQKGKKCLDRSTEMRNSHVEVSSEFRQCWEYMVRPRKMAESQGQKV